MSNKVTNLVLNTPALVPNISATTMKTRITVETIQTSSRSQPLRAAIHVNSKHWRFLEEAKRTLETIQFVPADCFDPETASNTAKERLTATQRKPPCINGYIQNINAIGVLWKIVHEQHDFSLLRTNKVCNDPLENEFGKIRRACGTNDAPNAHQFAAALKYSCIEKTLCSDYGTNCIPDEMSNLIEEQNIDESIEIDPLAIDESFLIRQFEPLEEDSGFLPDLLEVNALVYIVGFGVTKLKHKTCKDKLVCSTNECPDANYTFCKFKQYLNASGFVYPNNKALEIGATLLIALKQKFYKFLRESRNNVKARLKEYVDYNHFDEICCICFNKFVDVVLNTLLNGQVTKIQSKLKRRQRAVRSRRNGKARRLDLPRKVATKKTKLAVKASQARKKMKKISQHSKPRTCNSVRRQNVVSSVAVMTGLRGATRHRPKTPATPSRNRNALKRTRVSKPLSKDVLPCKMAKRNESVEQTAGSSGAVEVRPKTTADPELSKMQQVVQQLEQFVASFPKSERICVEHRDCLHLSKDSILSTYEVHKNELIPIFSKYRDYSDRQLRSVTGLVTWDEVSSVFSDDQQFAMAIFLEEKLVPVEQKGVYSEFIDTILIHEWGLRIYETLHKFASREDALTHIRNQEKAKYLDTAENN